MTYTIRPARRSEAKPLIGLYAESGCGKTMSALLLARGFVGPSGRIVQIETESGRGEAYADLIPGGYDVISLRDEFAPAEFGEAISVAEKGNADALLIDSGSHEWEATGGVLSMAAANAEAGKKGVLVWQAPKLAHQRHFVLRLLSTPIPLVVVCLRARYPMVENKQAPPEQRWTRSETLTPYQSEAFLFEMFVHGWIDRAHAFHGTKYSRPDLRDILRDGEPITRETGVRLAAWARGETSPAGVGDAPPASGNKPAPGLSPADDWVTAFGQFDRRSFAEVAWREVQTLRGTFTASEWQRIEAAKEACKQRLERG